MSLPSSLATHSKKDNWPLVQESRSAGPSPVAADGRADPALHGQKSRTGHGGVGVVESEELVELRLTTALNELAGQSWRVHPSGEDAGELAD